jgi:hypothetical protein
MYLKVLLAVCLRHSLLFVDISVFVYSLHPFLQGGRDSQGECMVALSGFLDLPL